MKRYRFFVHFNRVNMQRGDPKVWTVHFRGVCYQTQKIRFKGVVELDSDYKPDGRQPRATFRGAAKKVLPYRNEVWVMG